MQLETARGSCLRRGKAIDDVLGSDTIDWTVFCGLCCVDTLELRIEIKVEIHAVVVGFTVCSTMTHACFSARSDE